ncbi:transmembrane protein 88-like [Scleropages formosus]|uniref:Transmembrane protein 88-like n=1 Tax=Scleropages formosus TaxID=113540 RepID=A0A0P7WND0_SCLFO|nr:transmembrane protein 88-like [Scleropages formosus]
MCGVDVDLEDGAGKKKEEQDEECEMGERTHMLPAPPELSNAEVCGGRRGRCGCLAWGALLLLWNVSVALVCVLIMGTVFALVLLPTALLLYAGFLCHSRVLNSSAPLCLYLNDNSCSALIILGFVMMSPLVVIAAATFCTLALRLRLLLLFQPMAWAWHHGSGWTRGGSVRAWV